VRRVGLEDRGPADGDAGPGADLGADVVRSAGSAGGEDEAA
jgi:hypothetical protein